MSKAADKSLILVQQAKRVEFGELQHRDKAREDEDPDQASAWLATWNPPLRFDRDDGLGWLGLIPHEKAKMARWREEGVSV